MTVKRYEPCIKEGVMSDRADIVEIDNGNYVLYSEYERVVRERDDAYTAMEQSNEITGKYMADADRYKAALEKIEIAREALATLRGEK